MHVILKQHQLTRYRQISPHAPGHANIKTLAACLILVGAIGICFWLLTGNSKTPNSPQASDRKVNNKQTSASVTASSSTTLNSQSRNESLLDNWAAGIFTRLRSGDIRTRLDRYMTIDDRVSLTNQQSESLKTKLTNFLFAYSGTDFADYLKFRNPATMAGKDNPEVQKKLKAAAAGWNNTWGSPPTDSVSFMKASWRMFIHGEMKPIRKGPAIDFIDWCSSKTTISKLKPGDVTLDEWNGTSGTNSHFYKQFIADNGRSINPIIANLGIPNKNSVETILKRDEEIVFADFTVISSAADAPPHPILLRFVWDSETRDWLPLNAMKLWNNPLKPFVW